MHERINILVSDRCSASATFGQKKHLRLRPELHLRSDTNKYNVKCNIYDINKNSTGYGNTTTANNYRCK